MADQGDWTTDPGVVLAALVGDQSDRWLWPEAVGSLTETGLRLVVAHYGMVADAVPSCDGSWRVSVYRVMRGPVHRWYAIDEDLFDLAVEVWALDEHEPDWCAVVPRRPHRVTVDPGRRVAQVLLDVLSGDTDDPWEDGYGAFQARQGDRSTWSGWRRGLRGKDTLTLDGEGYASGVWARHGRATF